MTENKKARLDVWISSRDQAQAKLYLEDCKYWAVFLHVYFLDLGLLILGVPNRIHPELAENERALFRQIL